MITNIIRFLILLLLINLIVGYYITPDDNQQFDRVLKERSAENDNEYVWFTRNIPADEQNLLQQRQDLLNARFNAKKFHRKYPFVVNSMYERK